MKIKREANACIENPSPVKERNMNSAYEPICQNGNLSSSLPETFSRKLDLSTPNFQLNNSGDALTSSQSKGSCFGNKGLSKAQGNVLPDENDLFSGNIDEMICNENVIDNNGIEDLDLFRNTGCMELDVDQSLSGEVDRELEGSYGSLEYLCTHFGLTKNLINGTTTSNTHKENQVSDICEPNLSSCSFSGFHKELTVVNVPNSTSTSEKHHACTLGNNAIQEVKFRKRVPVLSTNGFSPDELCGSTINNFYWHNHSCPLMWSNSGSLVDGILSHPNVSSALPTSLPLLDKKHTHCADGFPESFQNEGFLSHSSLYSCICSPADGCCAAISMIDPYQRNQILSNRIGVTSVPNSFRPSSKYSKVLSHRRSRRSFSRAEREHLELDIGRVLSGEDKRTTLMIRNIPNRYNSKMLLAAIDEQCQRTYDFVYLPLDFQNNCNIGYAFINLIDPLHIIPFHEAFNGRKWNKFNSEKVVSLAYARIQGKTALIARFRNSNLMNEDKQCHPILFCTDGPNAGKQEPFPIGSTNIRKAGKVGRIITTGETSP